MNITAQDRRSILRLFNVSEAAREIGISVRQMHRSIYAGRLPEPKVKLLRRRYYTADDLTTLAERCAAQKNHP